MGSRVTIELTTDLLASYSRAALTNADDLLSEATLLRDNEHMARAYFLSVSCIEETGKALICFDGQNRNLSDPAVCRKLRAETESHKAKINYALSKWALHSPDQRKAIMMAIDLMVHLQRGREPSMYSELRTDPNRAQTPREIVSIRAAEDCVRLADNCLANAHRHIQEEAPSEFTSVHDKLFTMRPKLLRDMLNCEDFWWFVISRLELGQQDIAESIVEYEKRFFRNKIIFKSDA